MLLRTSAVLLLLASSLFLNALDATPRSFPVSLNADDVIPTGNEFISLPDIRASDGALGTFNVLSMRDRGLLQVSGDRGEPVLQPTFRAGGKLLPFQNPSWSLIEYWTPTARLTMGSLEATLTWCAPPGARAAFLRLTVTNRGAEPVPVELGLKASWGSISRVTYLPIELRGDRTVAAAPWVDSAEVFSYVTNDTLFSWALMHPGSEGRVSRVPLSTSPELDAEHRVPLAPGATAEAIFVLGAGVEEFSASHSAKALAEMLDRKGADAVIAGTGAWCRSRTRTTGHADLDLLMNRNFLFTALYAWGRSIDSEQMVGVTSRSPRYYVSAAYWDRDAMLWSFPGLLDIDKALAREAVEYALTIQLRNAGTHSRFIDGVVLEDGFQLDEAAAPILAFAQYVQSTNDDAFLLRHRDAVVFLRDRIFAHRDEKTGLYSSLQDSQDEYQKLPFLTYDNVLTWRAFLDLELLFKRLGDTAGAQEAAQRAAALRTAILTKSISAAAPGAHGPIFVFATDGEHSVFADSPPGSLMKLPALGFVPESDPVFRRTYEWLHSSHYQYSYWDQPYGLPGSYRVPFTTSWSVADSLLLPQSREQASKILRTSKWDGGIISEGVSPETAVIDSAGRAFATAAGYMAHAICELSCEGTAP